MEVFAKNSSSACSGGSENLESRPLFLPKEQFSGLAILRGKDSKPQGLKPILHEPGAHSAVCFS